MSNRAQEFFDRSVDHVRRGNVRAALTDLLDSLAQEPTYDVALRSAARICTMLGAPEDGRLFEELADRPEDPTALFSLGYRMVDQRRPDVAAALLDRCLTHAPDHPSVRRELAFARFCNRDFAGCLRALAPLETDPELADAEVLDVLLLKAEAAFYLGKRDLARALLDECELLIPDDTQRARLDGFHHMVGRSLGWESIKDLDLRAWHFIQHAGVVLKVAGGLIEDGSRAGRFDVVHLTLDMVAFLLQRLAHLLERLEVRIGAVAAVSPASEPAARALAIRLGAAFVTDFADHAGSPLLLMAANAAEFANVAAAVAPHRADLHLFSINLDFDQDEVVCPEVIGILGRRALLPWEGRFALDATTGESREVPGDERPPELLAADLIAAMDNLPDDEGAARAEFEALYAPLAGQLLLGNDGLYPYRRMFTSLSPCWSADDEAPRDEP